MNKRQIAIIFDGIIHEYLRAGKQFDTRNKSQIARPRFTAILQKLKNKIQADSKLVKLHSHKKRKVVWKHGPHLVEF